MGFKSPLQVIVTDFMISDLLVAFIFSIEIMDNPAKPLDNFPIININNLPLVSVDDKIHSLLYRILLQQVV